MACDHKVFQSYNKLIGTYFFFFVTKNVLHIDSLYIHIFEKLEI